MTAQRSEASADKPGVPLTVWVLGLLLGVGGVAVGASYLFPREEPLVVGGVVALAAAGAVVLGARIRSEGRRLEQMARALPEWSTRTEQRGGAMEFAGAAEAMRASSVRIRQEVERLQGERLQLEALLDSMQDAVVAVDVAGRMQWTNRAMQTLVPDAYSRAAVRVGQALVHTVRDPEVLECVKLALERREICERRTTSLAPGRTFHVNASPMPGGGAVAVLHDLTQMEQVERAQRDFVANVSHELRTPLTSISGYVETLLDGETLSPTGREFLDTILKNAMRMSRLTDDLLTLAQVESPERKVELSSVSAEMLVHEAVAAMSGLVQDEHATLEVGETTSHKVLADSDAMLQVLANLIENGIKYGRRAGPSRVVVSARALTEAAGGVEFSVRDFGQGIASEHLERIFERFYRVDKARSRDSGGTGLGLAIARRMVESQGGTIRAESELNEGSRFLVTLPAADAAGDLFRH